jgi:hypothetical protein
MSKSGDSKSGNSRSGDGKSGDEGIVRPGEGIWQIDVARAPAFVLAKLAEVAERWGGGFEPDSQRVAFPVVAGLRHGSVAAKVAVAPARGGSRVTLTVEDSEYRLQRPAVAFLTLAGAACLSTLVLPFFPQAWGLIPAILVLTFGAWFFIIARLQTSGPEEFLIDLRLTSETPPGAASAADGDE